MKKYRAIFFDWDGTAVLSRRAPVTEAVAAMKPLLAAGVKLVIISGTTMENIAGGQLETYFTETELQNLYLGLGRGAYNYALREKPATSEDSFREEDAPGSGVAAGTQSRDDAPHLGVFRSCIPDKPTLLAIHRACFAIHLHLLERYDFPTDIVFTRPNYCKIDLMVERQRGENLFMQENELEMLKTSLRQHGIRGGLQELLDLAVRMGKEQGIAVKPTCDAKYLEAGITSKSDNVDVILERLYREAGILPEECAFYGDEYVGIEAGIFGSDSFMITGKSRGGDFFDVSEVPGERPPEVQRVGGGVERFLSFLRAQ